MNLFLIITITLSCNILLIKSDYETGGWKYSDETHSLYQFFPNNISNYEKASKFCQQYNSALVVIDSPQEFTWIQKYLNEFSTNYNYVVPWV